MVWDPFSSWPVSRYWIWVAIAFVAAPVLTPIYILAIRPPETVTIDYFQEWASARNYLGGLPIYTEHRTTLPLYLHQNDIDNLYVEVNAHPPTSVLLAIPFSILNFVDSRFAWNIFSIIMFILSIIITAKYTGIKFNSNSIFPALTLLMFCGPLMASLMLGQLDLIILFLITGAWAADRTNRPMLAGSLLALSGSIKLFPLFMFIYFIVKSKFITIIYGLCALIIINLLTIIVFGYETYNCYISDVIPKVENFRSAWSNASLAGFWAKLFDPATTKEHVEPLWRSALVAKIGWIISITIIIIPLVKIIRASKLRAENDHAYGLTITGMLLVSPLTWDHYFVLLVIPMATLWLRLPSSRLIKVMFLIATLALWIWFLPIHKLLLYKNGNRLMSSYIWSATLLSYQLYALITIFILGLMVSRKSKN